eukprot:6386905-Prymnesium_polylepis.1
MARVRDARTNDASGVPRTQRSSTKPAPARPAGPPYKGQGGVCVTGRRDVARGPPPPRRVRDRHNVAIPRKRAQMSNSNASPPRNPNSSSRADLSSSQRGLHA